MSTITGIKKVKGREKRVKVYLDGKPALGLLAETALQEGLRVGQEITESNLDGLENRDLYQRCLNAAIRFLGYRPRSETEVRQRLQKHGFDGECLEKTLVRLKEQGLVDDITFARFWIDNREAFSPRSKRLTKMELRRKGLSSDVIEQVIGEVDERDSAYRAALKKAPRLANCEYQDFRRRLGDYLGRRGFNYGIIKEITERIWKEQKTQNSQ
ncbi:MAG: regulatory protein RecX [Dehalococcoidales bacterium]|nr:regulatory protein RecX [Dehalococcoidales bacterium]